MEVMKTKTLAEIYLKQGYLEEAYEIFKTLAEKDPADQGIREKLRILKEKLGLVTSSSTSENRSKEEKIETLEKWLANIRTRRNE